MLFRSLVNDCIDPRFSLVARGVAEFVEWLGAADNPSGRGWAVPGAGYGGKIVSLLGQIKATEAPEPTPPTPPDDGYPEGTPAWGSADPFSTPGSAAGAEAPTAPGTPADWAGFL